MRVNGATQVLQSELGRPPTIAEIAERLGMEADDVLAALEVQPAQHTVSLESTGSTTGEDALTLGERLGQEDENLDRVEAQEGLEGMVSHLTPRERKILALRYIEQLPQTEVAKRLGISQMHVSRLQRAAVEHLREQFGDQVPV